MKLSTAKTFTLAFLPGNAKSRSVKIYVVIASSELRSTSIHVFGDPDIEFDLGFTLAFFFFLFLENVKVRSFKMYILIISYQLSTLKVLCLVHVFVTLT